MKARNGFFLITCAAISCSESTKQPVSVDDHSLVIPLVINQPYRTKEWSISIDGVYSYPKGKGVLTNTLWLRVCLTNLNKGKVLYLWPEGTLLDNFGNDCWGAGQGQSGNFPSEIEIHPGRTINTNMLGRRMVSSASVYKWTISLEDKKFLYTFDRSHIKKLDNLEKVKDKLISAEEFSFDR